MNTGVCAHVAFGYPTDERPVAGDPSWSHSLHADPSWASSTGKILRGGGNPGNTRLP